MLEMALLLLTINDAGMVRLSVTEAIDMQDCIEMHETVDGMLTEFGYTVLGARCGPTEFDMTPFTHGALPEEEVHRYRVQLLGPSLEHGFTLEQSDESCRAPVNYNAFCAVSSQEVVGEASGS